MVACPGPRPAARRRVWGSVSPSGSLNEVSNSAARCPGETGGGASGKPSADEGEVAGLMASMIFSRKAGTASGGFSATYSTSGTPGPLHASATAASPCTHAPHASAGLSGESTTRTAAPRAAGGRRPTSVGGNLADRSGRLCAARLVWMPCSIKPIRAGTRSGCRNQHSASPPACRWPQPTGIGGHCGWLGRGYAAAASAPDCSCAASAASAWLGLGLAPPDCSCTDASAAVSACTCARRSS